MEPRRWADSCDRGAVTGECFDLAMNPRTWTAPVARPAPTPDPFLTRRLLIEDAWLGDDGAWRPIGELTVVELWSILGYLRWHAPALMAQDADPVAVRTVEAWLGSRPLVGAVERELVARGAVSPGESLETLRALGSAPWELPDGFRRPTRRGAAAGGR